MTLIIDPEFQSLVPPLSDDEYKQLEINILTDGCRDPISLWNDTILDGHNRFKICQEHELSFNTAQVNVTSRDEALLWIVQNQLGRRNLTPQQMSYFRGRWYDQDKLGHGGDRKSKGQNDPLIGDAADVIAEQSGISPSTVKRDAQFSKAVDKIADAVGPEARTAILTSSTITTKKDVIETAKMADDAPDLVAAVTQGQKTVTQAKQELKQRNNPTPIDRHRVLYADPPWQDGISKLCAMGPDIKEQVEDNSVLFLWVQSTMLEKCFDVIKAWGFKYRASFVRTEGDSLGIYNCARHEFLLICTRGDCLPDAPELFDSILELERKERAKEIIASMYTHGKQLELFVKIEPKQADKPEELLDEGF